MDLLYGEKEMWKIVRRVTGILLAILVVLAMMTTRCNHEDKHKVVVDPGTPAPTPKAAEPETPAPTTRPATSVASTTSGTVPTSTKVQSLKGLPAEIDALGDAAVRSGGKVNGVIILDARKKSQPALPKLESAEVREARMYWEGKKADYKNACNTVDYNEVNYATPRDPKALNDYTTNCSRTWRFNAKSKMDKAWEAYQEVLKGEQ